MTYPGSLSVMQWHYRPQRKLSDGGGHRGCYTHRKKKHIGGTEERHCKLEEKRTEHDR